MLTTDRAVSNVLMTHIVRGLAVQCVFHHASRQNPPSRLLMATLKARSLVPAQVTLDGTEADQLILGGNSADSIGSQYANSSLVGSGETTHSSRIQKPWFGSGSSLRGSGSTLLTNSLGSPEFSLARRITTRSVLQAPL